MQTKTEQTTASRLSGDHHVFATAVSALFVRPVRRSHVTLISCASIMHDKHMSVRSRGGNSHQTESVGEREGQMFSDLSPRSISISSSESTGIV